MFKDVKCRKWTLKSHFSGLPKREDLEIVEEQLPELKDGEFLCEAVWLSVDPYMRPYTRNLPLGSTMIGAQVARVIASKNGDYAIGDMVANGGGWCTHLIADSSTKTLARLDASVPAGKESTALGVLGMPGATAYFGFLEICKPKAGETLVINGAAGAVGSLVGQIAKIKGCKVVGFAGSDTKVEYLKEIGFDAAYNYKTIQSLDATLKEACPDGIDMFFDNVGGEFFETVLANMNEFGRVSVCGAISLYNTEEPPKGRYISPLILFKQLRVEGFLVMRWFSEWPKAFSEMATWIQQGKLQYREHVTNGFDNMFEAFLGLFKGDNIGKAVVKA